MLFRMSVGSTASRMRTALGRSSTGYQMLPSSSPRKRAVVPTGKRTFTPVGSSSSMRWLLLSARASSAGDGTATTGKNLCRDSDTVRTALDFR